MEIFLKIQISYLEDKVIKIYIIIESNKFILERKLKKMNFDLGLQSWVIINLKVKIV